MFKDKGHVHFVGVCGIGMAGLAHMLKMLGYRVSGCDRRLNHLGGWLMANDIKCSDGHSEQHVSSDLDFVVRTPAVSDFEAELCRAKELGIPVYSRGEVLANILNQFTCSIAVSGTHGKTSTSTFMTQVLRACNCTPGWVIGGENRILGGVSELGNGEFVVVESDESDGTLAGYHPTVSVINNIEFDHMDYFKDKAAFELCFRKLIDQTKRLVIYNIDDPVCRELCADKGLSFGKSENADYQIKNIINQVDGMMFLVSHAEIERWIKVPVFGEHNVYNAAAVYAVSTELGLETEDIIAGLKTISLPDRRFEKVYDKDNICVVTDYSHHPTEIKALIDMVRSSQDFKRLRVVFQPHRYSRTKTLGMEFPAAFDGVDELVLLPVYSASEKPVEGGTCIDLYKHFLESSDCDIKPILSFSIEKALEYYRWTLQAGDLLLIVGAGDVNVIAEEIRERGLSIHPVLPDSLTGVIETDKPLGVRTTFGCGGTADYYADISCKEQLRYIYEFAKANDLPLNIIGGGSNMLVSDLGVRGIVCRLVKDMAAIYCDDKGCIVAGAGITNSSLLKYMKEKDYSGLEFLAGVPGTLGGAVRMNAGAFGSEIFDYIMSVEYFDGEFASLNRCHMKASYRKTPKNLENKIISRVVLKVHKNLFDEELVKKYRDKRSWQKKYRTAGSTFKNPSADVSAGRLIDDAFRHPVRVGGAVTAQEHFNFICTDSSATASDVMALIKYIRMTVLKKYDITLETEVIML